MKPRLIDVHTHTQFAEFDIDRDAVICRALDAGIWMINVGTDRRMSESAIGLASKYEIGVFATAGLHPTEIHKKFDYDFYKKLAEAPKVVAIGECGLDYYRVAKHKTRNLKQKKAFEAQIELAHKLKKPLMIHCREAFTDLIKMLQVSRSKLRDNNPGVCHFFSGSIEDAQKLMDLGFSFSFGGVITFAREYEKLIKFISLDRILLETDAPYVAPALYRGKRNEPSYIKFVAEKLAEIKGVSFEEVEKQTSANAKKLFSI